MRPTLLTLTELNQKGISILTVIAILLILSVMGIAVISMVTSLSRGSANLSFSKQAHYVAEGGLERGTAYLLRDVPRVACADMSTDITLSNVSLGSGLFSVTQDGNSPYYLSSAPSPAILSTAILSTDLAIPVDSVAGYSESGRIMIDREWINYVRKETVPTFACSSPPCLMANLRGADGSTAAGHTLGTRVGQYQCAVVSTGGAPDLTTPSSGKRVVSQAVMLQEGWSVGQAGGGITEDMNDIHCVIQNDCWAVGANGAIAHWDGANWSTVVSPTGQNLNGVTCTSSTNCWAVGNLNGNNFTIVWWNGTSWGDQSVTDPANRQNLNGIHCVDMNNCWAVGNRRGNRFTIVRWNGAMWTATPLADGANRENLNGVHCVDVSNCWAVGNLRGNNFTFVQWNGTTWSASPLTDATNRENLNGVYCTSSSDCWSVGNVGKFLRWNGSSWSLLGGANATMLRWNGVATPVVWSDVSASLLPAGVNGVNAVSMLSYADGWAVGNVAAGNATVIRWDGALWTSVPPVPAVNQNLEAVSAVSADDAWAVGMNGTILRWNGTNWSAAASPTGQDLNGIHCVDANNCWAVGNRNGNNFTIIQWNGISWSDQSVSDPANRQHLNSIHCVDLNNCWAVGNLRGNNFTFVQWNGISWTATPLTDPVNRDHLQGVSLASPIDGWAVGNGGTILTWDGVSWTVAISPVTVDLNGVVFVAPRERPQTVWREEFN